MSDPNPSTTRERIPGAILGETVPEFARNGWTDAVVGPGTHSQNTAKIHALLHLLYFRTRDRQQWFRGLNAWQRYFAKPHHTSEPDGRFVYGQWNSECIQWAEVLARLGAGRVSSDDRELELLVSTLARANHRASRVLWALSAGPVIEWGAWPGYPVTLTGARSFTSPNKGAPHHYWSPEDGFINKPYTLDQTQLSMDLNYCIAGRRPPRSTTYHRMIAAFEQVGADRIEGRVTTRERANLLGLIRKRSPVWTAEQVKALRWCLRRLNRVPAPVSTILLGRTTECQFSLNRYGVNVGSTSPGYAVVRYNTRRPSGWWDEAAEKWKLDPRYGWLSPDPSRRNSGTRGRGEIVHQGDSRRRTLRAQRIGSRDGSPPNSWWDPSYREGDGFRRGWQEAPAPGEWIWLVEYGPKGATVLEGPEALMGKRID